MVFAGRQIRARKTVAEAAAEELRMRILSGQLKEGSQLRQEVLAAELGVSRIPLREALRLLEGEGLVTIVPHRGAVVSVLSPAEIGELFDLRALIEPELIRCAIPHLVPADLLKAEATLTGYRAAFERRDVETWGALNTQFHLALYRPARRPRFLALAQTLLDQADRYTRMQLLLTGGESRAQQEHEELLALCQAREIEPAAALLERHIRGAGRSLVDFMIRQAPLPSPPEEGRGSR
jgi:DNA-binding GntR family transcriptional regulator